MGCSQPGRAQVTSRIAIHRPGCWRKGAAVAALLAAAAPGAALAFEPLSDEQLGQITAGASESLLEEVVINASRVTASGRQVKAEGTLAVQQVADAASSVNLLLRDSAQSNLRALVNLNAVNSVVNVLLNLNINIDSQVGTLQQLNLTSPSPGP